MPLLTELTLHRTTEDVAVQVQNGSFSWNYDESRAPALRKVAFYNLQNVHRCLIVALNYSLRTNICLT